MQARKRRKTAHNKNFSLVFLVCPQSDNCNNNLRHFLEKQLQAQLDVNIICIKEIRPEMFEWQYRLRCNDPISSITFDNNCHPRLSLLYFPEFITLSKIHVEIKIQQDCFLHIRGRRRRRIQQF